MKKRILSSLVLILLVTGSSFAASTITRLTVDLDGQIVINDNTDNPSKRDPGYAVGVDLVFSQTPTAELGLGVEYQKERPWLNSSLQYIPIYGFINYHGTSNLRRSSQPYFTGRFGYSVFHGPNSNNSSYNSEGDLYYSLGFGINFQDQFRIEAAHSVSNGTERYTNGTFFRKYTYNRTTVTFGICF